MRLTNYYAICTHPHSAKNDTDTFGTWSILPSWHPTCIHWYLIQDKQVTFLSNLNQSDYAKEVGTEPVITSQIPQTHMSAWHRQNPIVSRCRSKGSGEDNKSCLDYSRDFCFNVVIHDITLCMGTRRFYHLNCQTCRIVNLALKPFLREGWVVPQSAKAVLSRHIFSHNVVGRFGRSGRVTRVNTPSTNSGRRNRFPS